MAWKLIFLVTSSKEKSPVPEPNFVPKIRSAFSKYKTFLHYGLCQQWRKVNTRPKSSQEDYFTLPLTRSWHKSLLQTNEMWQFPWRMLKTPENCIFISCITNYLDELVWSQQTRFFNWIISFLSFVTSNFSFFRSIIYFDFWIFDCLLKLRNRGKECKSM